MKHWYKERWFLKGNAVLNIGYYPMWQDIPNIRFYTNQWRIGCPCLSMTFDLFKVSINLTLFNTPFKKSREELRSESDGLY